MGRVYPLYKDPYERISIDISLVIQFVTLLSPSWRLLTLSPTIMEVENGCIWKVNSKQLLLEDAIFRWTMIMGGAG